MGKLTIITGGARSGKSSFAEQYIADQCSSVAYIATAQALDEEMQDRVARHKAQRPDNWQTFEESLQPSQVVYDYGKNYDGILLDCLTLLTSNIILQDTSVPWDNPSVDVLSQLEQSVLEEINRLLAAIHISSGHLVAVTNEVGLGIVPADPLSRFFRDCCGRVNQVVAAAAQEVFFVVSGIPMQVK